MSSYCPKCGENVDAIVERDRYEQDSRFDFPPLKTDAQLREKEGEFIRRLRGWMGGAGDALSDEQVSELWGEFSASYCASWLMDSWLMRGNFCGFLVGRLLDARKPSEAGVVR